MTRWAVAVMSGALVLAAGCGSAEGTPAAEPATAPKVAGRQLQEPPLRPYAGDRGPDCVEAADVTAGLPAVAAALPPAASGEAVPVAAPGPSVRVAPDCSTVDPGPFSVPLGPPPPVIRT